MEVIEAPFNTVNVLAVENAVPIKNLVSTSSVIVVAS